MGTQFCGCLKSDNPEGVTCYSPAFQRWVRGKDQQVPSGTMLLSLTQDRKSYVGNMMRTKGRRHKQRDPNLVLKLGEKCFYLSQIARLAVIRKAFQKNLAVGFLADAVIEQGEHAAVL